MYARALSSLFVPITLSFFVLYLVITATVSSRTLFFKSKLCIVFLVSCALFLFSFLPLCVRQILSLTPPCHCHCDMSSSSTSSPSAHRDKQLRIFDFKKGKMKRRYSESVETYQVCAVLCCAALWCGVVCVEVEATAPSACVEEHRMEGMSSLD
jgi:hypothetical protein